MKRSFIWILAVLGSLLALVTLAAAALLFWIDPNIFRDDFEALAAKQGVILSLDGELSWRFFPELQIVTHNTSVAAPDAPDSPIAKLNELSVAVAVMPLLDKEVIVRGLSIDGLDANLAIDKEGRANWEQLGKTGDSLSTPDTTDAEASQDSDASAGLNLAMESLSLTNGRLSYRDESSNLSVKLSDLNLSGEKIALDGRAFPARLTANVQYNDGQQALNTDLAFDGKFSVASDFSRFEVTSSQIEVALNLKQAENTLDVKAEMGLVTRIEMPEGGPLQVPVLAVNQGTVRYKDASQEIVLDDLQLTTAFVPGPSPQSVSLSSQVNADLPAGKFVSPLVVESQYQVDADFSSIVIK